jgi:hypothetical protein
MHIAFTFSFEQLRCNAPTYIKPYTLESNLCTFFCSDGVRDYRVYLNCLKSNLDESK